MGDEQQRHAKLGLQLFQELQDLRLHRDVQRRRRFIGDQQVGIIGQRHGDHHPLPLPARELVRIILQPRLRVADAHLAQQVYDARAPFGSGKTRVQFQHLAHLLLHRMQWIERGHRLLEDHGDVVAAHLAQVALIGIQ
jgi:hypothetical protein